MLAATLSPSLRHLLRLRALRERARARGQRGVPRLGEVRDEEAQRSTGRCCRSSAKLNASRRENPALQRLDNVDFLETENEPLFAYLKRDGGQRGDRRASTSTRRRRRRASCIRADATGLPPAVPACATCSPATSCDWHVGRNYVRLEPGQSHVLEGRRCSRVTEQWFERDPLWFKRAVFYEIHIRGFFDGNDDGSGDFRGLTDKLDYLAVARRSTASGCCRCTRRRCGTAATTSPTSSTIHPDYGTVDDFATFVDAGAPARHARDRRPRHEPHLDRPPVVPGVARRTRPARKRRLVRLVGRPTSATQDARIIFVDTEPSNWTLGPGRAASTTGTASSRHQPDLNYDNPEVQRGDARRAALLARPRASTASASTPCPYLYERDGTNGENLPETHEYLKRVRAEIDAQLPRPRAAGRGQPVAGGRRRVLRRRRRVPHGVPLPGDAAHVHGGAARGRARRSTRSSTQTPADPRQLPVGHLPAQPRRADARDGHRRGARLHVRGVREGPADEASTSASGRRLAPLLDNGRDEIELLHAILLLAARARRSSTTATRSAWATTSTSATATACARRCSGRATATRGFSRADFAQLYLPPLMDPGLRLPGGERRGAAAHADLAAALAAPLHRAAQGASRVRARHLRAAPRRQPARSSRTSGATRTTSSSACTTSRARRRRSSSTSREFAGMVPEEMLGRTRFPRDRRAAVPAHARAAGLLLVPAEEHGG